MPLMQEAADEIERLRIENWQLGKDNIALKAEVKRLRDAATRQDTRPAPGRQW
jgi:hypothetical protein